MMPPDPRLVALYSEIAQAHADAARGSEYVAYAANALAQGLDGDNKEFAKGQMAVGLRIAREAMHAANQAHERLQMLLAGT